MGAGRGAGEEAEWERKECGWGWVRRSPRVPTEEASSPRARVGETKAGGAPREWVRAGAVRWRARVAAAAAVEVEATSQCW